MEKLQKGQWTKEKAWKWYNSMPWIRGFNGLPSNCVNRIAMWQEYNHKEVFEQIEREFILAKETGFNCVRAVIQFEVWYYEHDSFMDNLEEYFCLADKHGLMVMLVLGNDCTVPKDHFIPVKFGEQKVDWGYHSGIKKGPHAGGYDQTGYCLLDEDEFRDKHFEMVDELARKYAKDERLFVWDVWNEPGNGNRGMKSAEAMKKYFEIIRSYDQIQPLTADCWWVNQERKPKDEIQTLAVELSDIITFHSYNPAWIMVEIIEGLSEYGRPLINNEWLNRLDGCNVADVLPLLYAKRVGSLHWGLMAGFSQTYEPYGSYYSEYIKENSNVDLTKWQHDIYRFNGLPYDKKEIEIFKSICAFADKMDRKSGVLKD